MLSRFGCRPATIEAQHPRRARGVLLVLLLIAFGAALVGSAPARAASDDTSGRTPRPWEMDPAPDESRAKTLFYEKLTRWVQEPTQAQLDLDVRYYDLALSIDPVGRQVSGTLLARLRVGVPEATLAELNLADALSVDAVTSGGVAVPWVHSNELVSITLDRLYLQDEEVTVTVTYHGTPPGSYGAFGFDSHAGQPLIWTLSEPFGARSWWPCDDWSDDKADSVDLRITVPQGLIVASNGTLRGVVQGSGTETYTWHEAYPISTYLVSLAIYPYSVYSDYYHYSPSDSMEIRFFIYPDHVEDTYPVNMMTADMIAFFANVYGEYPFLSEKYGHAEFNWGGAMEHQTCTSMGAFYETIVAHELSHQWWGDMVTCADFHHVWLNEGFATYSEALWLENQYGAEGYWGKMNGTRYLGGGTIYVPDLSDWDRIFSTELSYYKASWVLHMLRHVIGDEAFFQTLEAYRQAFEYGTATTEDFQAVAEAVSGVNLTDFFHQWIYEEYYPAYAYSWSCTETLDYFSLNLTVDQVQTNTALFHMPIDVRVDFEGGGSQTFVIDNFEAHQEYLLSVSGRAIAVSLDPDEWILKRVVEPVVDPTFDQGILLVNGVDWSSYGNELTSAYADRAFWGNLPISFWDCFSEPAGGYPATLPAPLGHGRVPSTTLGQFETVIWVGNNFGVDLFCWMNTSILPYLEAGGNVLLMTRMGDSFLDAPLQDYLGIVPISTGNIYDCIAVQDGLTNIGRIGTQNYCLVFQTGLTQPTSRLLYIADQGYNPNVGIAAWRAPSEGGIYNPDGGQFAFLSGRPYRWNHADLARNVEALVGTLFPLGSGAAPDAGAELGSLRLLNPGLGGTRATFTLAERERVTLAVYDTQGRLVERLLDGFLDPGEHTVDWDGRTLTGAPAPAGIYFVYVRKADGMRAVPVRLIR